MMQEVAQEVENLAREVMEEIHTALPGKIVSFNAKSCVAKVKPIGRFTTQDDETMVFPVITDVPIVFPFCSSKNAGVFFPVKPGDSCLIIISEVELDEWRKSAESDAPLRFDLSSAVAIPGLMKKGNSLLSESCSNNAVIIASKDAKVMVSDTSVSVSFEDEKTFEVKDGKVKINGDLEVTGSVSKGA